ncbi:hypothetical protein [Catenuloplanes japonicus]|uniref:hypothetical protein n=1 Tax=Catenuloplanes japonicus TaxID=33876 RepID=UPI0005270BC0|nr:hypothetical protein [Catenuloplanes japonicus]
MTNTITAPATTARPPAPAKNALPAGVVMTRHWRETDGGPIVKHDHERPVDDSRDLPVGVWWLCPASETCKTGEWVFPRDDDPGMPKKQFCADHGARLLPGRAEASDGDPKAAARGWLEGWLADAAAAGRQRIADATSTRIAQIRAAGRAEAERAGRDLREHVPSLTVSAGALVADYSLLTNLDTLPGIAVGTCLAVGGTVLAYLTVYAGELVYARRMGYTLRELPRHLRARARSRARWIASGVLATGVWLVIAEAIGADLANFRGFLMSMLGALLIAVVNYRPWADMVARRQAAARAAAVHAEAQARAEEERIEAERAETARQEHEAAEAQRAAEESAAAEARKIAAEHDTPDDAGRKFAERWQHVIAASRAANGAAGFDIARTEVVAGQTRKLTAADGDGEVVIGWEYLVKAAPGVLTPRNGDVSPFVGMKRWLADVLEIDVAMLDLQYQPNRVGEGDKPEPLINHGLVMISETFPLAEAVTHPGASGVFVDRKGVRWAFAGRGVRGEGVYKRHFTPGQAGGGNTVGVTGTGKSVLVQGTVYGDLLLGILPILHDAGKNAMDYVDFYGIVPVGHTIEHREIIRESLWAEMKRRQAWINMRTTTGLGGMEVVADPTWDCDAGGPPIRAIWDEFHMHMKDPKFVTMLTEMVRLQRATAIMAETATQGGGLADMGDNNLREQLNEIRSQLMRVTDHTARLTGYTGGIKPSDLPTLPGMVVMQEMRGTPVAYRAAFIPRDPQNPDSLVYRMRRPNGTPEGEQILFAPTLPPETIAVFEEHGLMDLWELGKTKSGRERLQSESDPVESTAFPADLAAMFGAAGQGVQPSQKPHMRAEDLILAMLKHESDQGRPGLTIAEIQESAWWVHIAGPWSKSDSGSPSHTTIGHACKRMSTVTDQQAAAGAAPLVGNDGGKPAVRWSLLAAGTERGEQMLNLIRSTGALGKEGRAQAAASGMDVGQMEREAMLRAEQEALIAELVREAAKAAGGA